MKNNMSDKSTTNYMFSGDRDGHIPRKIFSNAFGVDYTDIMEIDCIDNISLEDVEGIIEKLRPVMGDHKKYRQAHLSVPAGDSSLDTGDDDDDDDDDCKKHTCLTDKVSLDVGSILYLFESAHLLIYNQYYAGAKYSSFKIFSDNTVDQSILKLFVEAACLLGEQNTAAMPEDKRHASFSMIVKGQEGYETSSFRYDYKKFNNLRVETHYNSDFEPINEKIIKHINEKKSSGIVILHGIPGTGKTTYLRYLISKCKKNIIYLPPDMTNYLSDPGFISFMKQQVNCVFIVEDAEEILKKRGETNNSGAVSNILNVSDGILADVLHFNFIFTINCEIDQIDSALKRPGRLVAEYKFSELGYNKTSELIFELYPDAAEELIKHIPKNGLTLAQIYNLNETAYLYTPKKNGIGFTANIGG
jgi:broad-specificity NMP kinase